MHNQILRELNSAIKQWASRKRSYVSLSSYVREIEIWRRITGVHKVERLLEIGSGSGWFLVTAVVVDFADEGVGIDPAIPEAGTKVEEILETETLIHRMKLDDRVSFHKETFKEFLAESCQKPYDLIVFRNALHHIYPKKPFGKEDWNANFCIKDLTIARNLLNPGGYIYIVEACPGTWVVRMLYNLARALRGSSTIDWLTKRTKKQWIDILEKAGFECIGQAYLPFSLPFTGKFDIGKLTRVLSQSILLAGQVKWPMASSKGSDI